MYKCVANINLLYLHSFNTQFLISIFLSFFFSLFFTFLSLLSVCPSLFLSTSSYACHYEITNIQKKSLGK